MASNKVLITGASGLLGIPIIQKLIAHKITTSALSRKQQLALEGLEWIQGDLLNPLSYEYKLQGIETIIHVAGYVSYQKEDRDLLYKTNVLATRDLINVALAYKVQNFLYISSASTLIRSSDLALVSTQSAGNPVFNSFYAESKFLGELEVWRAAAEGLKVCILNPSLVLSKYSWDHSSMQIFNRVKQGLSYYPPGSLGLVSAEDIANIVLKIMNESIWNQQFLVNAETWTYKEFLNAIAKGLNTPEINKEASLFAAKSLSFIERFASFLNNKHRLITQETIQSSFTKFKYDDFATSQTLNYNYQDIKNLIEDITALG
ncbi:MAG: NAD-dependent epimerase/dehydratase family protein [Saprospiraceae bacterium]|nr:NAD-dependent epimerase/dehydratase family protein [Saprospiraceae bacterium]